MDTFAAFALATEPPHSNVLEDAPWKEDVNVLKTEVWGQIIGMTVWNTLMMILIIVLGPTTSGLEYEFTDTASMGTDAGKAKAQHLTLIYNTFVFLQIFN